VALVHSTTDPTDALAAVSGFLVTDPVAHNVALSILHERVATPVEGRYWWVEDAGEVRGYAWQSPPTFFAGVVPMARSCAGLVADAMFEEIPELIGVIGNAATAAAFTGRWTELTNGGATPAEGQRIYELERVEPVPPRVGDARLATLDDVDLVIAWTKAFNTDTGMDGATTDLEETVRRRVKAGWFWLWDAGEPVGMTMSVPPVSDVTRVGMVYTPPSHRGNGYASALVARVSEIALSSGSTKCVLYTQLSNSSSNGIYRRIGYRAVGEVVAYRFTSRH
jgi:ribosomal protein S18 acetylase RimI-like enzyme